MRDWPDGHTYKWMHMTHSFLNLRDQNKYTKEFATKLQLDK